MLPAVIEADAIARGGLGAGSGGREVVRVAIVVEEEANVVGAVAEAVPGLEESADFGRDRAPCSRHLG